MKFLVTGVAGFIGAHVARALMQRGDTVVGVDNLNDYYEVSLKEDRLVHMLDSNAFRFERADIADRAVFDRIFRTHQPDRVIHLAAQAGVRYSLENPHAYIDTNITGFLNLLEAARAHGTGHLVYASTSSVYGSNTRLPYSVRENVDHPLSLYAATKKSNELMAHTYAHLFRIPCTGLRFFTVYGPWGRPDMAPMKFTRRILAGEAIDVFNFGQHSRDFTYIDDIVEGVLRVADRIAEPDPDWDDAAPDPAGSSAPYRLYNIGNQTPVSLLRFIELLEETLGLRAEKNLLPMQPGDVVDTFANVDDLIRDTGYQPSTPLEDGIRSLVGWYKHYYEREDVAHNVR